MSETILQNGQISSVSHETATSRTAFDDMAQPDGEATVSGSLQMLFPAMGLWQVVWSPKEGDHVTVARAADSVQEGVILGTRYTARNLPKGAGEGLVTILTIDGENYLQLDAQGSLLMKLTKSADIEFGEDAIIEIGKNMSATVLEDVTMIIGETLSITAKSVAIEAPDIIIKTEDLSIIAENTTITGDVTINGNLQVNGSISATGDIIAGGISLRNHTHTAGAGTTSPPIGGD
jgi:phage baseplate assembly protein gpV